MRVNFLLRPFLLSVLLAVVLAGGLRVAAAPRVAVLDFALTSAPGSRDPRVSDYAQAVQAGLFATPGFDWVERQELARLMAEHDLAAVSRSDASSAVRIGHLARADILLRGEIATTESAATLQLEAVDMKRAEVLATRVVPVTTVSPGRIGATPADIAAAVSAAAAALDEARQVLARTAQRTVAPLYFKNIGRTERLDFAGGKLQASLQRAVQQFDGARWLSFPRSTEAGEESSLVLAGLTDTDPEAWQHVADVYLWGTVEELGQDGMVFEEVPVRLTVQFVGPDDKTQPLSWEGPVKTLDTGMQSLAAQLVERLRALPPGGTRTPAGRLAIAGSLRQRAGEVARQIQQYRGPNQSTSAGDFLRSPVGRQLYAYRLQLLQTACFFDPLNRGLQQERMSVAWAYENPAQPLESVRGHWLRLADHDAQARRFANGNDPASDEWLRQRQGLLTELLQRIKNAMYSAQVGKGERPEELQVARRTLYREWAKGVVTAAKMSGTPPAGDRWAPELKGWLVLLPELIAEAGELSTARTLVLDVWPALERTLGNQLKDPAKGDQNQQLVNELYSLFDAFGEYDRLAAMLDATWKVGEEPLPAGAKARPAPPARADREWKPRVVVPNPALPGMQPMGQTKLPALAALAHEIEPWPVAGLFAVPEQRTGLMKSPGRRVTALAWKNERLWIAESALALPTANGSANPQGNMYVWRYDPALHASEYLTAALGGHSLINDFCLAGSDVWLALDADGVWKVPESGNAQHFGPEQGLTSTRVVAAATSGDELMVLAQSGAQLAVNQCSLTSGKWSANTIPPQGPAMPMGPMVAKGPAQIAVSKDWIAVRTNEVTVWYNRQAGAWTKAFGGSPLSAVSVDGDQFWIGGFGAVVPVKPDQPLDRSAVIALPGAPLKLAHHGRWLWVLVADPMERGAQVALIDKVEKRCVGLLPSSEGKFSTLAVSDTRVWIGGTRVVEYVLAEARPSTNPAPVAADHPLFRAAWRGDLAAVKAALAAGAKVNEATERGWTPLLVAIEAGHDDVIAGLLDAKADPNVLTRDGATPLALAAINDSPKLTELLLARGGNPALRSAGSIRGLFQRRQLLQDTSLPPDSKAVPAPPTDLRAEVRPDGQVALTWQEHAGPEAHYIVTRRNVVVADLPAGIGRCTDPTPDWDVATETYAVVAENASGRRPEGTPYVVAETTVRLAGKRPEGLVILSQGLNSYPLPFSIESRVPLHHAAAAGSVEIVQRLLAAKADPNAVDAFGETPLLAAVRSGHYDCARLLLAAGANPAQAASSGESAASVAYARHDDLEFFRALMTALPAAQRKLEATTLIYEAADHGQIRDLELLRQLGGDINNVTGGGLTPLAQAIQRDQVETALWLLDQGAKLHQRFRQAIGEGLSDVRTLEYAIQADRPEILTRLLDAGCDPNLRIDGEPAIVLAAKRKSFSAVRLLAAHGADLSAKSERDSSTVASHLSSAEAAALLGVKTDRSWPRPRSRSGNLTWANALAVSNPPAQPLANQLVEACRAGDRAAAEAALKSGALLNQRDDSGVTALHAALDARHPELARWLVARGASVNVLTQYGNSPLTVALFAAAPRGLIEELLQAGADPNAFGSRGVPALVPAVISGDIAIVKRLLAAGAEPNLFGVDNNGGPLCALALALRSGRADVVDALLEGGANPRAQPKIFLQRDDGRTLQESLPNTLLNYAAAGGNLALVKRMIQLGQDPKATTLSGEDALTWAAANGRKEVVEFLLPYSEHVPAALNAARASNHPEIAEILSRARH